MSDCREVAIGEVCYTSAAGVSQTLFATNVYDHDGSLMAVVYHNAAGVVVDTAGGTVVAGACAVPPAPFPICVLLPDGETRIQVLRTVEPFDVVRDQYLDGTDASALTALAGVSISYGECKATRRCIGCAN